MIEFEPQDGVRFIKNVMIEMEDGVRVALDMHVPDDGAGDWRVQAQPLLLEYIPYRKDDNAPYSGHHHRLAQNGIIGARLDCRGSGSSEGVAFDEYTEREQRDFACCKATSPRNATGGTKRLRKVRLSRPCRVGGAGAM